MPQSQVRSSRPKAAACQISGSAFLKEAANLAEEPLFVVPGLVAGTIRAGWKRLDRVRHDQ
jgi:hypothetical protein